MHEACRQVSASEQFAHANDVKIGKLAVAAAQEALDAGRSFYEAASLCVAPLLALRSLVGTRLSYAQFLTENGLELEAVRELREAIEARPSPMHGVALEAHRAGMSRQAPRWHFRMMNDALRNRAYRAAVHRAVRSAIIQSSTAGIQLGPVLDIGAGAGLLAAYALESLPVGTRRTAGAPSQRLVAVESSPLLAQTCR